MVVTFLIRTAFIVVVLLLIDWYVFSGFKVLISSVIDIKIRKLLLFLYWSSTIVFVAFLFWGFLSFNPDSGKMAKGLIWAFALMVLFWFPKLIITIFLLVEDVTRLTLGLFNLVKNTFIANPESISTTMHERRKFVSQIAFAVASIPFASILYGIIKGKYDYRIHKIIVKIKDLPTDFEGFTITQISDVHSGSFDDTEAVQRGINMIKDLESDMLVFTGDLVNNLAEEFDPWIETFGSLHANYGKYSILGNHDYSDYVPWKTPDAKENNLNKLKSYHQKSGFRLLLNENIEIKKQSSTIKLAGVENWGLPPFRQSGDLNKALEGISKDEIVILLSHDPSHWDAKVLEHPKEVALTLSGHTHGMQFGIEIAGFKWSPVKYKYPRWAGLFEVKNQQLYVNRGFGFIGFSGRVGIWPEITQLILQKA